MTDKPTIDSFNLVALAAGIYDAAQDVESGRDALVEAYNTYNWRDDQEARKILTEYGDLLQYKFKDQTDYLKTVPNFAESNLSPIPLSAIPSEEGTDPLDYFTKYADENIAYLNSPDAGPAYLVRKRQIENSVQDFASAKRREWNATVSQITDPYGHDIKDLMVRGIKGATAGVTPYIDAAVNIFTDNFQTSDYLTELTDPANDGKFAADLIEGAGNVGGLITAGALTGGLGAVGFALGQAADPVVRRYYDTLEATGQQGEANKATALEAISQTIQLVGEAAAFGRVSGVLTKSLGQTQAGAVVKQGLTEVASEGFGQGISNTAENVQKARPMFEDVWRGVGKAAAIGGLVAAGVGAAAHTDVETDWRDDYSNMFEGVVNPQGEPATTYVAPAANNTAAREQEIDAQGYPVTPVTKQIIGDIVGTVDDLIPGEGITTEDMNIPEVPRRDEEEDDLPKVVGPNQPLEGTPSFEDGDGNVYYQTANNQYTKEFAQPAALTFFADKDQMRTMLQAIDAGSHVVLNEEGVAIESKDANGDPLYIPLKLSTNKEPGKYVVNIGASSPDKLMKNRLLSFSHSPIKQVYSDTIPPPPSSPRFVPPSTSAGAASLSDPAMLGTTSSKVAEDVKNSDLFTDIKQAAEAITNVRTSNPIVEAKIADLLDGPNGLQNTISALANDQVDPTIALGAANSVFNALRTRVLNAEAAGDFTARQAAANELKNFLPILNKVSGSASRTLYSGNVIKREGIQREETEARVDKTYLDALNKVAIEEQVSRDDITSAPANVQTLSNAIASQTDLVKQMEIIDAELPAADVAGAQELLTAIETEAQENVSKIEQAIDIETADLQTELTKIEKKAARQEVKDTAALEETIAVANVELANALQDAAAIKTITAEESATLEDQFNKNAIAAEKAANKELQAAVAAEREKMQATIDAATAQAQKIVEKAQESLNKTKALVDKQVTKLKTQESDLKATGQPTTEIDIKAAELNERLIRAAERVEAAKARAEKVTKALEEKDVQLEETLKELEEGVTIRVTPVGKKRAVVLKTKRSGLDVTKLFRKSKDVGISLSGVSAAVNELSNVVQQSLGTKAVNNERISALRKSIENAKKGLDILRNRQDKLDAKQRKRADAILKRLNTLEQARKDNTIENSIPAKKKKEYAKFTEFLRNSKDTKKTEDSDAVKAARQKLKALEEAKKKAERLAAKLKVAQAEALAEAARMSEVEKELAAIETALASDTLTPTAKKALQARQAVLQGVLAESPALREVAYRNLLANLIGQPTSIAVGQFMGIFDPLKTTFFSLPLSSIDAFLKNVYNLRSAKDRAKMKYQIPLLHYLSGLVAGDARERGFLALQSALVHGDNVESGFSKEELANTAGIRSKLDTNHKIDDFLDAVNALKFKKTGMFRLLPNTYIGLVKTTGKVTGTFLRVLKGVEALTAQIHRSGFERAAAAAALNKGLDEGVSEAELMQYMYDPKNNWEKAKATAAIEVKKLRDIGVPVSKSKERVIAIETYQAMPPREVRLSAFKMAGSVGLNIPAQGYVGVAVDAINSVLTAFDNVPVLRNAKYLALFVNSLGVMLGRGIEASPLAAFGLLENKVANRTDLERKMLMSSAITSTAYMAALGAYALSQLDLPEEERVFDIIGQYSSSPSKRAIAQQNGVIPYSVMFKILGKKYYIPYAESQFVLTLGGIASIVDKKRDGKMPDYEIGVALSMAGGMMEGISRMSMLKGVTELVTSVNDAAKGSGNAHVRAARALINTGKGILLPMGILRTISRYTDNPVDAKLDIASAIVEGFPGFQEAYGLPALNVMGEVLGEQDKYGGIKLHRILSSQSSDADLRWLVQNGYALPELNNLSFDTEVLKYLEAQDGEKAREMDYKLKHKVMRESSSEIRRIVGQYRSVYQNAAPNKAIQEGLKKDIRAVLTKNIYRNVTSK